MDHLQPSARQKELERAWNARKGHVPQISISDDSHHVTEAIGSYYGDSNSEDSRHNDRPLSFISSPKGGESIQTSASRDKRQGSYFDNRRASPPRRTGSGERVPQHSRSPGERASQQPRSPGSPGSPGSPTSPTDNGRSRSLKRMSSLGRDDINNNGGSNGGGSGQATPPPLSRHGSSETAVQHFPLNDIDYESSPAAVAQELSNLQAIRRMSMNVDMADPDLPSFGGGFAGAPTNAPAHGEDDDDDASRLFWVPARLHPELAPKEFKTFVEERVDQIRRSSGDSDTLSTEGLDRSGSGASGGSSLRRKKSMLSRQIDTKGSYQDGAERLERKRSKGMQLEGQAEVSLHELEDLANDPAQLMRRMSLDTARTSHDSGVEVPPSGDLPILPPVGQSLKRSTRTTYRRGSLRKGERVPFSKRAMGHARGSEQESAEMASAETPTVPGADEPIMGLTRVQTEPTPAPGTGHDNFSRPSTAKRRPGLGVSQSSEDLARSSTTEGDRISSESLSASFEEERAAASRQQQSQPQASQQHPYQFPERRSSNEQHARGGQSHQDDQQQQQQQQSEPQQPQQQTQRQPQQRQFHSRIASQGRTTAQLPGYNNTNPLPHIIETLPDGSIKPATQQQQQHYPERKSSHEASRPMQRGGAHMRPVPGRERNAQTSLDDISGHPSPLPGSGNMGTDALTMVPTFGEEKKAEKNSRKSSWKWILGSDDEDKGSKKGKESKESKDEETSSTKSKASKLSKASDKSRLDLLQTSIDGGTSSRGRESLVLDRDSVKLDEERKKESSRKFSSDSSRSKDKDKEKDGKESSGKDTSILSAIFGGGKKKTSEGDLKDKKRKHLHERTHSPEAPARVLKPDIDYNWTRFSILEERAIYRMAHMKLANPRRALYSQVLLSNFMYSYLAKVQMMHPQMQIPGGNKGGANGKGGGQQRKEEQPAEYSQYQRWQEQQSRQDSSGPHSSSSYQQHHNSHSAYDSYDTDQSSPGGSDHAYASHDGSSGDNYYSSPSSRPSCSYSNPAAQQRANGIMTGTSPSGGDATTATTTSGGYSVSSTHDYLGYPKDTSKMGGGSSGGGGLWDESEREEELW
ncbi:hypothetical protein MBLNU230_g6382t1 [Neophaeotheca triangularis]